MDKDFSKIKELVKYLGGPVKAAKALSVGQSTASGWQLEQHFMRPGPAIRAEKVTNGKFKRYELCPDLAEDDLDKDVITSDSEVA